MISCLCIYSQIHLLSFYEHQFPGKEKIAVIAHDFDNVNDQDYQDRIANFRLRQPKTFDSAGLVLICGKLAEGNRFPEPSKAQLLDFLIRASEQPEGMKTGVVSSFQSMSNNNEYVYLA